MAHIEVGDHVRIHFEMGSQFYKNPARVYQGEDHVVVRKRELSYGTSGALRGTEYYLDACESEFGVPYAFLEEHLVRL